MIEMKSATDNWSVEKSRKCQKNRRYISQILVLEQKIECGSDTHMAKGGLKKSTINQQCFLKKKKKR